MKRFVRSVVPVLALLLYAALASAQSGVRITPDVVYGHKDGMALTFDVFQPENGANGAGVLFMVSGGWVSTWSPPEQAVARFRFLLDEGFTVFAVRHGSSPRYKVPEAFTDVKRAARYVALNSATFAVDPQRLGAWGGSAGGHLSLMLAATADAGDPAGRDEVARAPSPIAAVVAYFPPTDLRAWANPAAENSRFPALAFDPALAPAISPILHVTEKMPPVLMIHGDADRTVPLAHSTRLLEVLKAQGIVSDLIVVPGAGHGFTGEDEVRAREALMRWFKQYLLN